MTNEWENGEFEDLAGELRVGGGGELRAEAEEVERLSAIARLRRRSLAQAAKEALHRGDAVTVVAGSHRFLGNPVAVGRDYLTVETPDLWVDARLEAVATIIERSASRGGDLWPGVTTLKARLSEYEGETIEVVCSGLGSEVTGKVLAVGIDHLLMDDEDGREWLVPLAAVTLVIRWRDRAQR